MYADEQLDKIDVARILIASADGTTRQARVSTVQAANHILESWANNAPEMGDEICDVRIVLEDGLEYQSSLRLSKSLKRIPLSRHVRSELTALASAKRLKKNGNGADSYILPLITDRPAESARHVLERYDI